jgi:GNAT superfamily N-acetyltransferase
MFTVKTMSKEDFKFAVRITDTMSWNQAEEDFKFMTELEPEGCFVLLYDSERAGIVTTISFGRVGWLGNLIVDESHRKKRAGSLLVKHAVKYLTDKNVETVGLYAYTDKVPFYRTVGFEYDSEFVVLKGKGFSSPAAANLREAKRQDIQEIVDYDHSCFGASRRKLLEPILLDQDNLCYTSIENARISGYAVAKIYGRTAELGPLVCRQGRSDIAINLLKATLNRLKGSEVSMCVPKKESLILNMLMLSGFSESFRVARMFFGPPFVKDCIYIAESLERG